MNEEVKESDSHNESEDSVSESKSSRGSVSGDEGSNRKRDGDSERRETSKKKRKGKMMTDEFKEDARVGIEGYKRFLKFLGGWRFIILSQSAMIAFTAFKILSDY